MRFPRFLPRLPLPIAFLLAAAAAAGEPPPPDLLWPLAIDAGLAASFGEFRGDRFHAGVDLSTRGEVGHPVRAAADGELFRLKIEWRGYGRAVYIRHRGGWVTVYAHLDRLENERLGLADRVEARRRAAGDRFPGDLYLDPPLPVRRGDRIGWSGQAGAGGPHLHFELRDPGNRPVDPIASQPGWIEDRRPPIATAITLEAADAGTFLDGHRRRLRIPLRPGEGGRVGAEVPIVDGPFTATLEVFDPAPPHYRLGPARIAAGLGDQTLYEFELPSFAFSETRLAGLVFDLGASRMSPAVYSYRLVRRDGNRFGRGAARFRPPADGIHSLWFETADASGNRSRGVLPFLSGTGPRLLQAAARPAGEDLVVDYLLAPGSAAAIESLTGEPFRLELETAAAAGDPFLPAATRSPLDGESFHLEVPAVAGGGEPVRLRYRLRSGRFRTRWAALPVAAREGLRPARSTPGPALPVLAGWKLETFGGGADLSFRLEPEPPAPPAVLSATPGGDAAPRFESTWEGDRFVASLDLDSIGEGPVGLALGGAGGREILLPLRLFRPAAGRPLRLRGFGATLDLPAGAQYGPETLALTDGGAADGSDLPVRGGPVRLLPGGTVFRRPVALRIEAEGKVEDRGRLGIYRRDRHTGGWRFAGPAEPDDGRYDRIEIRRGGTYALLEDDRPPAIVGHSPAAGERLRPGADGLFRATIREVGKGLDWDGVRFVLDGEPCGAEFDPDRDLAICRPDAPPGPGPHLLVIDAVDRAGNRSDPVRVEFRVDPGRGRQAPP